MRIVRLLVIVETSFLAPGVLHSTRGCLSVPPLPRLGLRARLEQPGKSWSDVDEDHRPQYTHEEGQRKPAWGHQGVENKNVDDHRRQHGHRERHVTVGQQKYRCDDLKREDHPQVMRCVQCAHELSCKASRRGKGNEVQEAVEAENKKDHARQMSGDYGSDSHNWVLLFTWRHYMTSSIFVSIQLMFDTSG